MEQQKKAGQTETTNGAVAWATSYLSADMGLNNPEMEALVNTLVTLWSATGMAPDAIRGHALQFLASVKKLRETHQKDADNFLSLLMAYTLYKRSVRHGGGRKDESRESLLPICLEMQAEHPELVKLLLTSYFTQGYWKDAWLLLEKQDLDANIRQTVLGILVERLKLDSQICQELKGIGLDTDEEDADGAKAAAVEEERKLLIKQLSNCAKFCPQVKGQKKGRKKDSTAKNTVELCLPLAKLLFPEIHQDTWYYRNDKGAADKSKKHQVNEKTPVFYKWRSLLKVYTFFMTEIRKQIPYVEKYMHKGTYHEVNPSMLTSLNKTRLDAALKNKPPRYLKPGAKSKIPKKKIEEARIRYGQDIRVNDPDRKQGAERMQLHDEEVAKKQVEKKAKMEEKRRELQELQAVQNADSADEETQKKIEQVKAEMQALQEEKTTNFSAGTPIDVWKAYTGANEVNPTYEACIGELALGPFAQLLQESILCISDTSGSMGNGAYWGAPDIQKIEPIDVCAAMTAFFAMHAPAGWSNKFIQFAGRPFVRDVAKTLGHQPTFFEFCSYMLSHELRACCDMSTNFEGVLEVLKSLFTGVSPKDLPKYLIVWSDMQFNQCVQLVNKQLTAAEQLRKLFVEIMGFSEDVVPIIVFWNLNAHDNRPAMASDQGVVMLSGFNPKMLLDLHMVVENAVPQAEIDAAAQALLAEQNHKQKVDTWTTIVKTLAGSEATVPFLIAAQELIGHTLLDALDDEVVDASTSAGKEEAN
jgi:hypothetical protein